MTEGPRPGDGDPEKESVEGMLLHVVLFRPKGDLDAADRENLVEAIERVYREVPGVRRFRVGKRAMRKAGYAAGMPDYPFVALLEFDGATALDAYLQHPAHADLARRFWASSDSPLIYDFELVDVSALSEIPEFLKPEA